MVMAFAVVAAVYAVARVNPTVTTAMPALAALLAAR